MSTADFRVIILVKAQAAVEKHADFYLHGTKSRSLEIGLIYYHIGFDQRNSATEEGLTRAFAFRHTLQSVKPYACPSNISSVWLSVCLAIFLSENWGGRSS